MLTSRNGDLIWLLFAAVATTAPLLRATEKPVVIPATRARTLPIPDPELKVGFATSLPAQATGTYGHYGEFHACASGLPQNEGGPDQNDTPAIRNGKRARVRD